MEAPEHDKQYQIASMPTRLLNYVIDQIIFLLLIMGHKYIGININLENLQKESPAVLIYLMLLSTVYCLVMEIFFSKTVGKMITRTRVVDVDGEKPTFKALLIRSMCRNIPFDNVSYLVFPFGWHDSISNTRVVHDTFKNITTNNS